jgi:hypothetical protein
MKGAATPSPHVPSGHPLRNATHDEPEGTWGEGWGEGQGHTQTSAFAPAPHPSPLPALLEHEAGLALRGERGRP